MLVPDATHKLILYHQVFGGRCARLRVYDATGTQKAVVLPACCSSCSLGVRGAAGTSGSELLRAAPAPTSTRRPGLQVGRHVDVDTEQDRPVAE
eukprot:5026182-Pyramimonas_sp.AAC.1